MINTMDCKHILLAGSILATMVLPMATLAQNPEANSEGARVVLQRFLDLNKSRMLQTPEAKLLLTGEALGRWESPYWGILADSPDRVELLSEKSAVGRVQWYGANEQITDFYFYLTFDGAWKLEAMRNLALTGVVEMVYLDLKKVKDPTEEQLYQLRNSELTLASDAKLRKWFADNQASLTGIVQLLGSSNECFTGSYAKTKCLPDVQNAMRKTFLGAIRKEENGDVYLTIGGITDNEVGFLYSPRNNPPRIDPSEFIWVERIADHWYLYRTT